MDESKKRVKEFISRHFRNYDLRDDEDIFAIGFVNSLFAMQLVLFVESEFNMQVDNEDLDIENFRTISAIAALVEHKRAAAATRA